MKPGKREDQGNVYTDPRYSGKIMYRYILSFSIIFSIWFGFSASSYSNGKGNKSSLAVSSDETRVVVRYFKTAIYLPSDYEVTIGFDVNNNRIMSFFDRTEGMDGNIGSGVFGLLKDFELSVHFEGLELAKKMEKFKYKEIDVDIRSSGDFYHYFLSYENRYFYIVTTDRNLDNVLFPSNFTKY